MSNTVNLTKILEQDEFTDILSNGFTLKELYDAFDDITISFKDFSEKFFEQLSCSFTYNSKKKIWEKNIELDDEEEVKLPKLSDQLLEYVRLTIETCLSNYLDGMSQEEFRRLISPLTKEAVKDEFSSKVIPAVINNLTEYFSKIISEIESNQEVLLRTLVHEKFQTLEARVKKLERK